MKNLNDLKKMISEKYAEKYHIYLSMPIAVNNNFDHIVWANENIEDFFKFLNKLDKKVIYFAEIISTEKDDAHYDENAYIEISFIHDNLFHVFNLTADWVEEYKNDENTDDDSGIEDQDNPKREELLNKIKTQTDNQLSEIIIDFITNNYPELKITETNLYNCINYFWESNGLHKYDEEVNPEITSKIDKVEEKVLLHFSTIREEFEEQLIPELIVDGVKWCKRKGLKKLTTDTTKEFLKTKKLFFSVANLNSLKNQVNDELK
jgi:hypothetical protein